MEKNDHSGVPPLLNATNITNDLKNSNVATPTKTKHKPLVIHLNAKKEPNATGIMDKQHEHLLDCPSSLVKNLDNPF